MIKPKLFFYIFFSAITAATVAGLTLFVTTRHQLAQQVAQLEETHADIQVSQEQLQALRELQDQYEQVAPLSDRVNTILPDHKAQSEATAELAAMTRRANLDFNNLNFETTSGLPNPTSQTDDAATGGARVMTATFSTTGTYGQIQVLLTAIENNLRHMQVASIAFTRQASGELKATLTVDIYLKS